MNIVTGFACSIGIDMGYNTHHHEHEIAEGSVHHHGEKKHQKEKSGKEDCCKDSVTKISLSDKELVHTTSFNFANPYALTALPPVNELIILYPALITYPKYYNQGHHPPIPDICIAIQSFLI